MKNVIAVIWDFDKTLVDGYMQDPIFKEYHVNSTEFWNRVNELPKKYEDSGVMVNPDTIYLNEFIKESQPNGKFDGLNNERLREFGKQQKFYNGIPDIFSYTKTFLEEDPLCKEYNIEVEHYIVSTGFAEVIRGTALMDYVTSIWGCHLIERTDENGKTFFSELGYTIDNTTKTRAIFEISKGVNIDPRINVNSKMSREQRRVDIKNMIYIADGPSDVPAFSVVKQYGGATFAIYPSGDMSAFKQVEQLRKDGRIDMFAEADYSENRTAHMWICNKIREIAERIKQEEKSKRVVGDAPHHLI